MIEVTGLQNKKMLVNPDLIQKVEFIPDTLIVFSSGEKLFILESNEDLIQKVIDFKKKIFSFDSYSGVQGRDSVRNSLKEEGKDLKEPHAEGLLY